MGTLPGPRSGHLGAVVKAEGLVKKSLPPSSSSRAGRQAWSVLTGRKGPNSRGQELGLVSPGLSLPLSRTSRRRPPPSLPVELGGKLADNFAQSSALLGNPFALPRGRKEYIRGGNFSTYPFIPLTDCECLLYTGTVPGTRTWAAGGKGRVGGLNGQS